MSNSDAEKTFESSINALKTVYYVIIGLAITEALKRALTKDGVFVGAQFFNLNKILLAFALVLTICRFVHGASIHLGKFSEKRHKPIFDFVGFMFHGIFFYVMAIALDKPFWFLISFIFMLSIDVIWLLILKFGKYSKPTPTENQWLSSDIIIIILFLILLCIDQTIDKTISSFFSVLYIFMTALMATYFDYNRNWDIFYFPKTKKDE